MLEAGTENQEVWMSWEDVGTQLRPISFLWRTSSAGGVVAGSNWYFKWTANGQSVRELSQAKGFQGSFVS